MTRKRIGIEGMSCGHCVNHVKEALTEDIQGVKVIDVSLENKYATCLLYTSPSPRDH